MWEHLDFISITLEDPPSPSQPSQTALCSYFTVSVSAWQNNRDQQAPRSQNGPSKSSNHILSPLTFHSFLPQSVQTYFQFLFFFLSVFLPWVTSPRLHLCWLVCHAGQSWRELTRKEMQMGKISKLPPHSLHWFVILKTNKQQKPLNVSIELHLHWEG